MKNLKIEITSGIAKVTENGVQIASMSISTVKDEANKRTLSLIENVEVNEDHQHKGIYTEMLTAFAKANFAGNQFYCSIGRSFEAASFWAKKLQLTLSDVEAYEEKDQQERALIINSDLTLNENTYSPDLFDLFW
jgi:hypothetical protein